MHCHTERNFLQAQGCSNGTDTQFGKAYGFLVVGDCSSFAAQKSCILAMARMLLRVVNRIGAGKFSLYLQGSSYHTLVPGGQVIVSLQVQRCSLRWRLYRLCGILIDEMAEK